jgi:arsenical pump membrane protein
MAKVAAISALVLMVGLVISRPRLPFGVRVGPALAALSGVVVMIAAGYVRPEDAQTAADVLWRPLLAITSIMVMAAAALRLGVIDRLAGTVLPRARGSVSRLFALVFVLGAGTAAVLNNDSAVLLLTPFVVITVRALYPDDPELLVPFAFAVFMAAGVAPLVTANPMNLIVADYAGIGFNEYALRMLPISVVGWVLTFLILRWVFRRELAGAATAVGRPPSGGWTARQWQGLVLVLTVLGAYPIVSSLGGSVWPVAFAGALLAIALCVLHRASGVRDLLVNGVSWEVLVFLPGVFMLAIGLQNAGVVEWLTSLYDDFGIGAIGTASALGSALINNHSMALTNLLALESVPRAGDAEFLAALIGGDLGPRLLPIGSLAGLLWISALRRLDVDLSLRRFVTTGAAVTVPTLALSLALLELEV